MRCGFVLDQGACIGCHACTVGCKVENDVPLGAFRTWVKWIEHGQFPSTRRSAAVLRCNHCEDAPCVAICPTIALFKRGNGIVDLDPARCIGCKSFMQACPYDAIHIDPREGTAAKCHLCAHRLEVDLAPACVSVCPEQAIKVVDLDDPHMRGELGDLGAVVRKADRKTRPQTFYLGADPAALNPLAVDGSRTLSHAEVPDPLPAPGNAEARAVYDIPRPRPWGRAIVAYMVTKALAAGALLAAAASPWMETFDAVALGWTSLLATLATLLLLVADLGKPFRFHLLLVRPNTRSWLVRGGWILTAHLLLSVPWMVGAGSELLGVISALVAVATAAYTAFLFRQARGRELWSEDRMLAPTLVVQAVAAGAAMSWFTGLNAAGWMAAYSFVVLLGSRIAPPTRQARLAHRLMVRDPDFIAGLLCSIAAVFFPPLVVVAFVLLDAAYIRAGQGVPLS
jgi:Fe-S-cluster-containing dehydrogenase component